MAKVLAECAAWQQCAVSGELLVCVHVVLEDVEGGVYEGDREREECLGAVRVLACGHGHERVVQRGGQGHGAYFASVIISRGDKICSEMHRMTRLTPCSALESGHESGGVLGSNAGPVWFRAYIGFWAN